MSSNEISQLLGSLPDEQSATVTFTDLTGKEIALDCIYKELIPPSFFLLFPPGDLPDNLDLAKQCSFSSQDHNGFEISFYTKIVNIATSTRVEMVAMKSFRPEELRQYFRVSITTPVKVSYDPENPESQQQPWQMHGETIDLSQSGVLTMLPDECRNKEPIDIEISFTNPSKKLYCVGHVIRTKRIRKFRWLVSFHFDEISSSDRDYLAKTCFAEHRRQLREKVRTS